MSSELLNTLLISFTLQRMAEEKRNKRPRESLSVPTRTLPEPSETESQPSKKQATDGLPFENCEDSLLETSEEDSDDSYMCKDIEKSSDHSYPMEFTGQLFLTDCWVVSYEPHNLHGEDKTDLCTDETDNGTTADDNQMPESNVA